MNRIARTLGAWGVVLAMVPATLSAQSHAVDRGSALVAGTASFTSSGNNVPEVEGRTSMLVVQPRIQYFVAPGVALGGEVSVSRFSQRSRSTTSYGVGPAVSYYFGADEARAFHPYLTAGAQYQRVSVGEFSSSAVGARGGAGIAFMLSPGVALDGSVFYAATRQRGDAPDFRTDVVGVAAGVAAFVF